MNLDRHPDPPETSRAPACGTTSSRRPTAHLRKFIEDRLEEMAPFSRAAEKIVGVPQDAIRGVLRGKSPTYKTLLRIFDALDLQLTIAPIEERDTLIEERDTRSALPMTGRPGTAGTPRRAGFNDADTPENVTRSDETHSNQHGDAALRTLIRHRLDELGVAPGTAERAAGIPARTIRSVLRGSSPRYDKLLNICEALYLRMEIKQIDGLETRCTIPARHPVEPTDSLQESRQAARHDVLGPTAPAPRRRRYMQRIIGERLRDMDLSIRAAESVTGLKRDTIRNILRGCSPTYRNLVKVCDALGLKITIEKPAETAHARRRRNAKNAVYKTFRESKTSDEVITALRAERTNVIAEVMDEMIQARNEEEADELGEMAAEAGHKIW